MSFKVLKNTRKFGRFFVAKFEFYEAKHFDDKKVETFFSTKKTRADLVFLMLGGCFVAI